MGAKLASTYIWFLEHSNVVRTPPNTIYGYLGPSQVPPDPLGASDKVPRGHAQKGDTFFGVNFIFFEIAYEFYLIVDHKT